MAPTKLSRQPMYLQIRDALVKRIVSGAWKPGQAVPNEIDPAREFGVSPGTMRKALDRAESERLLTRRQGRGTFVNDLSSLDLASRYVALRRGNGEHLVGEVIAAQIDRGPANDMERARLELAQAEEVLRARRVRRDGDKPFMYERVFLPARPFADCPTAGSERISVLARRLGLWLGKAEERIAIRPACPEAAQVLGVPEDTPVLLLDRVVRTVEGQPVEWRLGQCVPQSYFTWRK